MCSARDNCECNQNMCINKDRAEKFEFWPNELKHPEIEKCNICYEDMIHNMVHLDCGHHHCYRCTMNWLRSQKEERLEMFCPLCRTPIQNQPYLCTTVHAEDQQLVYGDILDLYNLFPEGWFSIPIWERQNYDSDTSEEYGRDTDDDLASYDFNMIYGWAQRSPLVGRDNPLLAQRDPEIIPDTDEELEILPDTDEELEIIPDTDEE